MPIVGAQPGVIRSAIQILVKDIKHIRCNSKIFVLPKQTCIHFKQSEYGGEPKEAKHFTPRIGVSVSLTKSTSAYALYDQAFIPQAGTRTDGEDVQPITGNNIEFGLKRDWAGGRWNSTL